MAPSTFAETLQAEVAALQTRHPILAGALDKAYTIVVDGGVFPLEDGHTAHVRSQSDPTVSHLVNGTCDCKATQYHTAPCAHRLAFRVYQRTVERLTVDPEEERWEPVETVAATPPGFDGDMSPWGEPPARPAAPSQPVPALPEAPASVNVRLTIDGREVQLTLRDSDETRLLQRLTTVLQQYPVPAPQAPQPAQGSPQGQPSDGLDKSFCQKHQVPMKWNDGKDGRKGWHSHRLEDGSWCKGRGL